MTDPARKALEEQLRALEQAAGAMIVLAGGPSFYDAQARRNEARAAILKMFAALALPAEGPMVADAYYVLQLLIAAGHVSTSKVTDAIAIAVNAGKTIPHPKGPQ